MSKITIYPHTEPDCENECCSSCIFEKLCVSDFPCNECRHSFPHNPLDRLSWHTEVSVKREPQSYETVGAKMTALEKLAIKLNPTDEYVADEFFNTFRKKCPADVFPDAGEQCVSDGNTFHTCVKCWLQEVNE